MMRINTLSVVLAQAGTHTRGYVAATLSNKAIHAFRIIGDTAYGSPPSRRSVRGTDSSDSNDSSC